MCYLQRCFVTGNCIRPENSSSSSISTTAHCGLWSVEQCPSIFSYLPPTLSVFSLPALEYHFLLPLSTFSWVFPFFSSLPVPENSSSTLYIHVSLLQIQNFYPFPLGEYIFLWRKKALPARLHCDYFSFRFILTSECRSILKTTSI